MKTTDEILDVKTKLEVKTEISEVKTEISGLHSDFNKYTNSNNLIIKGHETRIIRLEDLTIVKESNAEFKKKT